VVRLLEIWVEGDVDLLMVTLVGLTAKPPIALLNLTAVVVVAWSLRLRVQKYYCDPKKVVAAEAAGLRGQGQLLFVPEELFALAW